MNAAVSSWRHWGSTIGRCLKIVFCFFFYAKFLLQRSDEMQ